jgi:hypothetical protein
VRREGRLQKAGTTTASLPLLRIFREPIEVVGGAVNGGQYEKFGDFIAVKAFDFGFQGGKLLFDGFDQEKLFAGRFDLPFPTINGLNGAEDNRGAGREALADDSVRDVASFDKIRARNQRDANRLSRRHDVLPEGCGNERSGLQVTSFNV